MSSQPSLNAPRKLAFGPFAFDEGSGELRKHGVRLRLEGQPLQILAALIRQPGEAVSRDEFQQQLWGDGTFVDFDHGLNAAMNRLRQVLGDSAEKPRYIETLPGRGYRFIAAVQYTVPKPVPVMAPGPAGGQVEPREAEPLAVYQPEEKAWRLWKLMAGAMADSSVRQTNRFKAVLIATSLAPVLIGTALWLDFWVKKRAEVDRLEDRGAFYASKWTEPDIRKGIEYYNRAIALDPKSASAYAGLAVGWNFLSDLHVPPREAMPRSKAAAIKAIEIDETFANAHIALGVVKMQYEWDWAGAEQEFKRAMALEPKHSPGHRLYGWYLIAVGRFDEAKTVLKRTLEVDPLDDSNLWELGLAFYFARQYEQAVEQYRRAIGVERTSFWPHMLLGWAYEQQGKFGEAVAQVNQAMRLNDNPQVVASLGHVYARSGQRAAAEKVIGELQESAARVYVSPYEVATVYAGLGDEERTLTWLEKAYEERCGWLAWWLKVDPKFDAIRADLRFRDLLRRIGHER